MTEEPPTAPGAPSAEPVQAGPRIVVLGLGGAGGNAVDNMIRAKLEGVEFLVANTDAQALEQSLCERKVQLGRGVTEGLGAGSRPEVGKAATEESLDEILSAITGAHMLFVTAGMGGGTGTGGAPVIARAAREAGLLTVGVITKPFHFEGARRMRLAEAGIGELSQHVDTLIVIPNQNLFRVSDEKTTFADAFRIADEVLHSGVRGVTDLMVMPGLINLDFADIQSVMAEMGKAIMGTGESEGENRALEAAQAAISNPLLDEVSMQGARGVLVNISGGMDLTLFEVDQAANRIREEVDPEANIIFGSVFDQRLEGRMRVSVVATGIDAERQGERPRSVPLSLIVSRGREQARSGRESAAEAAREGEDRGRTTQPDTTPTDNPAPTSQEPATDPEPAGKAVAAKAGEADNSTPPREGRTTVFRVEPPADRQTAATLHGVPTPERADAARPPEPSGTGPALREVSSPDASGETQTEPTAGEATPAADPEPARTPDGGPADDTSSVVPMRAATGSARKYKPLFRSSQKPAARTETAGAQEAGPGSKAASPGEEPGPAPAGGDSRQGSAQSASAGPEGGPKPAKRGGFFSWVSGRGSSQLEEHFEKGDRYYYGQGMRKNLGLALRSYHKAAEMGHAAAQNRLGWMYEKGEGVEADHAEAVKWYLRAAEQGHVNAMNDLGYMYRQGWGVPQSYGEALRWFRKASEKYDSYAEYNMGQMYENGWGVDRDLEEAVRWFRRSAARGHEWAAKRLEELGVKS